jgi:dipeptidyl aminopeptidase/acylaminoacyl peptidase
MRHPRWMIGSVAIATLVLVSTSAHAQRAMTIVDLINVPTMGGAQISPDGRQIVYTVARPDWAANRTVSHIWRIDIDGNNALQLTNGPEGESTPRWSPDGKVVAFSARRGGPESLTQLYILPNGGGEAQPLTKHATSVTQFTWAPDGRSILFLANEAKTPEEQAKDRARDDVFAFDENYRLTHLWKVDVATGAESRLTTGEFTVSAFSVSRDGSRIVHTRSPNPLLDSSPNGEVWLMDLSGGNASQVTNNTAPEGSPELSPDNRTIVFTSGANAKFESYYNGKVFTVPASGGDAKLLTPTFPYDVQSATWSKDGTTLYLNVNMGVRNELFSLDPTTGKTTQLTDGVHTARGEYVHKLDLFVLTIAQPTNPGEFYLMNANEKAPRRVTHMFDYLARDYRLPKTEPIKWKGADGVMVEGILYYPLDYTAGTRYPLIVQTHGGPQSSDQLRWTGSSDYIQVLSSKGYFVLKPNYRGSTGYGDAFLRDMVGHYFVNAHKDVLMGAEHLVRQGMVDSTQMGTMGWSAGGHMTNKLVTFTNKFKAASSGAGAANWISMYAQSDVRTYRTPWFGGTPWQKNAPIDAYWDNSPLKYAGNASTPTLFLVGQNDERVPMPQSVEMYRALKSNKVPTHLYVAPREGHGWQELRHRLFKSNVELDWFEKWITKRPYTWEKAPTDASARTVTTF